MRRSTCSRSLCSGVSYDACLRDLSAMPDFKELMEDQASKLGENWYHETHEDFVALELLDPRASGEAFGPTPFGRLSAHGRWFVESMDVEPDEIA